MRRVSTSSLRKKPAPRPPKSIDQLAQEQGLTGPPLDYVELASGVWRTREELREFQRLLRASRQPSRS